MKGKVSNLGNRTALNIGTNHEFEANNLIPVSWWALFAPEDFRVEERNLEGEDCAVAVYRTTQKSALQRIDQWMVRLKKTAEIWEYLRVMEFLREILISERAETAVELVVTQFWAMGEPYTTRVTRGPAVFAVMADGVETYKGRKFFVLEGTVLQYAPGFRGYLDRMHGEELAWMLLGLYFGEAEEVFTEITQSIRPE